MRRVTTERGWLLPGGTFKYFNILGSNLYKYHQLMKLSFSSYISKAKSMMLSITYPFITSRLTFQKLVFPFKEIKNFFSFFIKFDLNEKIYGLG